MQAIFNRVLNYFHLSSGRKKMMIQLSYQLPNLGKILFIIAWIYDFVTTSNLNHIIIFKIGLTYCITGIIRYLFNRPRPYEKLDIEPLYFHKIGHSFPSRHCAMGFIVALCCLEINLYIGIIAFINAIGVAITRFTCGLHYISDIIGGITLAYLIYFLL